MRQTDRQLIVNADDFGMSSAVNAGIETAFVEGIVTSASLMVRREAAREAADIAAARPGLSVGLHLDLGEWVCRDGEWAVVEEVVALEDADAVETEVLAQLTAFEALLGRAPTHIDAHQHVHLASPVREIVASEAARLGIPARGLDPRVRYRGDFYGRTGDGEPWPELISAEALIDLVGRLPAGCTELGCHPGGPEVDDPAYGPERWLEVKSLTNPRVRAAIVESEIALVSFATLAPRPRPSVALQGVA